MNDLLCKLSAHEKKPIAPLPVPPCAPQLVLSLWLLMSLALLNLGAKPGSSLHSGLYKAPATLLVPHCVRVCKPTRIAFPQAQQVLTELSVDGM